MNTHSTGLCRRTMPLGFFNHIDDTDSVQWLCRAIRPLPAHPVPMKRGCPLIRQDMSHDPRQMLVALSPVSTDSVSLQYTQLQVRWCFQPAECFTHISVLSVICRPDDAA